MCQLRSSKWNGNIIIEDAARLRVVGNPSAGGDQFIIANQFSKQFTITTRDSSLIQLEDIEFKTQTGTSAQNGSIDMSYSAYGSSRAVFQNIRLQTDTSWLLANFHEQSVLEARNISEAPTEIYLNESCSVTLEGPNTHTGYWLTFSGGTNVLNLPDLSAPYNWEVSRASGHDVDWALKVVNALAGPSVILSPAADLTVNGRGVPETGELTIGYVPGPAAETLDGLKVGLQNRSIGGRLHLNNVQLGPVAWQIYVGQPAPVTIVNSTINEIGVLANSNVTVDNCVMQLAVLECSGTDGVLNLINSDVWNQKIVAASNGLINITGCNVFGSEFITRTPLSRINISNSVFFENPVSQAHLGIPPVDTVTGYPNYDPFAPTGPSTAQGPGQVTVSNSVNDPL